MSISPLNYLNTFKEKIDVLEIKATFWSGRHISYQNEIVSYASLINELCTAMANTQFNELSVEQMREARTTISRIGNTIDARKGERNNHLSNDNSIRTIAMKAFWALQKAFSCIFFCCRSNDNREEERVALSTLTTQKNDWESTEIIAVKVGIRSIKNGIRKVGLSLQDIRDPSKYEEDSFLIKKALFESLDVLEEKINALNHSNLLRRDEFLITLMERHLPIDAFQASIEEHIATLTPKEDLNLLFFSTLFQKIQEAQALLLELVDTEDSFPINTGYKTIEEVQTLFQNLEFSAKDKLGMLNNLIEKNPEIIKSNAFQTLVSKSFSPKTSEALERQTQELKSLYNNFGSSIIENRQVFYMRGWEPHETERRKTELFNSELNRIIEDVKSILNAEELLLGMEAIQMRLKKRNSPFSYQEESFLIRKAFYETIARINPNDHHAEHFEQIKTEFIHTHVPLEVFEKAVQKECSEEGDTPIFDTLLSNIQDARHTLESIERQPTTVDALAESLGNASNYVEKLKELKAFIKSAPSLITNETLHALVKEFLGHEFCEAFRAQANEIHSLYEQTPPSITENVQMRVAYRWEPANEEKEATTALWKEVMVARKQIYQLIDQAIERIENLPTNSPHTPKKDPQPSSPLKKIANFFSSSFKEGNESEDDSLYEV